MQIQQIFAKIKKHKKTIIRNCFDTIAEIKDTKIIIQQANKECWRKNIK